MGSSAEGIIRFRCHLSPKPMQPSREMAELMAWRTLLYRLKLVGQDETRYGGLGFGNISVRCATDPTSFVITGSQTGSVESLAVAHLCRITSWSLDPAELWAEGEIQPSSESLTHAAVYASSDRVNAVLHVHCPELWRLRQRMALPVTDAEAGCGTAELALEIRRMMANFGQPESGVWVLGGHEDGVLAFGPDTTTTGLMLLDRVAKASIQDHRERLLSEITPLQDLFSQHESGNAHGRHT